MFDDILMDGGDVECPKCERAVMRSFNCKLICDVCGYIESCEDVFVPNQESPSED